MVLQTTNALLLIRCFTKYIVEIENENALLEQLNNKSYEFSSSNDLKADESGTVARHGSESPAKASSNSRAQTNKSKSQDGSVKENSSENSVVENDSDLESSAANSFIIKNNDENHVLHQLIKNIFELCIEIPVQYAWASFWHFFKLIRCYICSIRIHLARTRTICIWKH
jgi:hypothetical protein